MFNVSISRCCPGKKETILCNFIIKDPFWEGCLLNTKKKTPQKCLLNTTVYHSSDICHFSKVDENDIIYIIH